MAYKLWISESSGYRRKGTRMSDLRKLFETGIIAKSIEEPLKYCFYEDKAEVVKAELKRLEFDIAGICPSKEQPIIEFIQTKNLQNGTCKNAAEPIKAINIISESTPLIDVMNGLKKSNYFFVQDGMQISGIITRADLQKPPVRILIFGIISLLEMHISFLIRKFFSDEKWKEILKQNRIDNAINLLQKRKELKEEIDLRLFTISR